MSVVLGTEVVFSLLFFIFVLLGIVLDAVVSKDINSVFLFILVSSSNGNSFRCCRFKRHK